MASAPSGTALALVLLLPGAALAGDVTGVWLSHTGEARMLIERCGDELCGRIVWLDEPFDEDGTPVVDEFNPDPARRDDPVMGMTILRGVSLEPGEDGMHRGGRIYNPDNGHTWHCRIGLADDGTLRMRGYLAVPLLGRTVYWTPSPVPPTAAADTVAAEAQ